MRFLPKRLIMIQQEVFYPEYTSKSITRRINDKLIMDTHIDNTVNKLHKVVK